MCISLFKIPPRGPKARATFHEITENDAVRIRSARSSPIELGRIFRIHLADGGFQTAGFAEYTSCLATDENGDFLILRSTGGNDPRWQRWKKTNGKYTHEFVSEAEDEISKIGGDFCVKPGGVSKEKIFFVKEGSTTVLELDLNGKASREVDLSPYIDEIVDHATHSGQDRLVVFGKSGGVIKRNYAVLLPFFNIILPIAR